YIQITPVLLGDGIPLFQKGTYEARFEMLDTTRFGEFIELHYVRK
ncbi:TPA: dihydrofolate reductase, partial [Enterococcus faecium]|nr:dihydrofolate reductase [Enterococcus faecium]